MCFVIASLLQFCLFLDDNIYCCAWKLWSGLLNGTCHAWPSPHKWRPGESSQHPSTSIREEKHKCWHSSSPMLVPNNTLLSTDDKYKNHACTDLIQDQRSWDYIWHPAICEELWTTLGIVIKDMKESQESPFSISSVDPISLPLANITNSTLKHSWKVKHSLELGQSHKGTRQASRQAFQGSTTFRSAKLEPSTFQNTESKLYMLLRHEALINQNSASSWLSAYAGKIPNISRDIYDINMNPLATSASIILFRQAADSNQMESWHPWDGTWSKSVNQCLQLIGSTLCPLQTVQQHLGPEQQRPRPA